MCIIEFLYINSGRGGAFIVQFIIVYSYIPREHSPGGICSTFSPLL